MPVIRVVEPGYQTTVQDLGRPGCAHMGVSASGAADTLSFRLGNLLVGNPENTSSLEMTFTGGVFEFDADNLVALTGADFQAKLDGTPIPCWVPIEVKAGQTLALGRTRGGARCYLSVHGGIDVPLALGSASTHLRTGLGGLEGRALRAGDELRIGPSPGPHRAIRQVHPQKALRWLDARIIRVTLGPQAHWFSADSAERFFRETANVSEDSDRMSIRLAGIRLRQLRRDEMLTEGICCGAVQALPDGQPVISFVEHQTTGAYPKFASVITADLPRLGQLMPGGSLHFELVSFEDARAILRAQEEWIDSMT
jgi:antagonist of KipI